MPRLTEQGLTDNRVRSAKPQGARYDIYDARVRGLGVRVAPSGTKSWFVMRRVNGRMVRKTFGRYPDLSLARARIEAAVQLAAMATGEVHERAKPTLVRDAVEEWFERDQANNRTVGQVKNALTLHVLPELGGRKLGDVRKGDILRIIDRIADAGAGTQSNRVLAFLRRFFNWCVERDYLTANPTAGIPKPHAERARERVLSRDELGRILRAADGMGYPFGPFIRMLVLTGQRRDEVADATWSELDMEARRWMIPGIRAKNGQQHVVHISDGLAHLLKCLPRFEEQDYLFSTNRERPISGFSVAKKRLDRLSGVSDWTLHDLRRSFATHATESFGVSPVVVDKILNHQSGAVRGVTAVYQRGQYLEERKRTLEVWGQWIESFARKQNYTCAEQ